MRPEDRPLDSSGFEPRGDQIDRLDALLTSRRARAFTTSAQMAPADLAPLLAAAETLAPFAEAQPSTEFAAQLEARLMARVEARAEERGATLPMIPFTPSITPAPARFVRRASARPRRRFSQLTWAAVAACLVLGMTVGALTASAHPGAPFYPLRKAVEGISADLTGSSVTTARNDLQRVSAALTAFDAAASQGDNAAALSALGQLTQADHQAGEAIAQVGDSGQRAALQSQLNRLRAQEAADLRAALPNLSWPARIQATSALRTLNATALAVTSARIAGRNGGDSNTTGHDGNGGDSARSNGQVTVIVNGAGFTPGAVLLINGQQAGAVDSVAPETLVAHLDVGALGEDVTSVGVGEPDGSAASTTHIESDGHGSGAGATPEPGDHATPSPDSTSTPGDGAESTPNLQKTPGVTPSPNGDH